MAQKVDPDRLTFMVGVLLLVLFFPVGIPLTFYASSRYKNQRNLHMEKIAKRTAVIGSIIWAAFVLWPFVAFVFVQWGLMQLHDMPFGTYGQFYDKFGIQWIFRGEKAV